MSSAAAMQLWLGDSAAMELQRILAPVCERVAIAGSVRRRCEIIHDIEVVVIPKVGQSTRPGELLSSDVDWLDELMRVVARKDHPVLFRPKAIAGQRAPAWGERSKRLLLLHQRRHIKVDLYITTRARFGSILAIRTGDQHFSHLLVTQRQFGGAMPASLSQAEGALQHIVGRTPDGKPQWEPLYTPEEADYFRALELPVLRPDQRTKARLQQLLALPAAERPLME